MTVKGGFLTPSPPQQQAYDKLLEQLHEARDELAGTFDPVLAEQMMVNALIATGSEDTMGVMAMFAEVTSDTDPRDLVGLMHSRPIIVSFSPTH